MAGSQPLIRVRHRFPTLDSLGVAVEYFSNYRNVDRVLHSVEVIVFSVALRGRARHFIDDDEFEMKPGSVGVTSYGQKHDVVTNSRGMEKFNVYLDTAVYTLPGLPSPLGEILSTLVQDRRVFRHHLNRGFHFSVADVGQLRATLRRIETELRDRRPGYHEVVRACMAGFFVDCCRGAHESGLVRSERQNQVFPAWAAAVRSELDERFAEQWTLAAIAEQHGISIGHLCRTFAAYTGKTVVEYLVDRRIQAAMLCLETASDKTLQIAVNHGFTDYSYFHRQFRKRTGQSPSQYRRSRQTAG